MKRSTGSTFHLNSEQRRTEKQNMRASLRASSSSPHGQDGQVSVPHPSPELAADTQQADTSLPPCLYRDCNVPNNHCWPQLHWAGSESHPVLQLGTGPILSCKYSHAFGRCSPTTKRILGANPLLDT